MKTGKKTNVRFGSPHIGGCRTATSLPVNRRLVFPSLVSSLPARSADKRSRSFRQRSQLSWRRCCLRRVNLPIYIDQTTRLQSNWRSLTHYPAGLRIHAFAERFFPHDLLQPGQCFRYGKQWLIHPFHRYGNDPILLHQQGKGSLTFRRLHFFNPQPGVGRPVPAQAQRPDSALYAPSVIFRIARKRSASGSSPGNRRKSDCNSRIVPRR